MVAHYNDVSGQEEPSLSLKGFLCPFFVCFISAGRLSCTTFLSEMLTTPFMSPEKEYISNDKFIYLSQIKKMSG